MMSYSVVMSTDIGKLNLHMPGRNPYKIIPVSLTWSVAAAAGTHSSWRYLKNFLLLRVNELIMCYIFHSV